MRPRLQVISTSYQDSKIIANSGADRIELVSALEIGGITPPKALLRKSLEISDIPTMIMVRHHNQGFVHDPHEKDLLIEQAISVCEAGGKGIVVGSITENNRVDEEFLSKLKDQISNKIDVTFHKASDLTSLSETYEKLREFGIKRVLTQGGKGPILENSEVIKDILKRDYMTTLLGGGINANNVQQIVKDFHPQQIHIGTCVRKDKYGPVQGDLVQDFIKKLNY